MPQCITLLHLEPRAHGLSPSACAPHPGKAPAPPPQQLLAAPGCRSEPPGLNTGAELGPRAAVRLTLSE